MPLLISTKITNIFMIFMSFVSSTYLRCHLHIEVKHGFDWGYAT